MTMNACQLCPYRQQLGGQAERNLSPYQGRKKTGNGVGVKARWRRMAGYLDSGKWGWVELAQVRQRQWAWQAGHDSISKQDSHTHYILFILESTGCDIWHLPVSVRHFLSGTPVMLSEPFTQTAVLDYTCKWKLSHSRELHYLRHLLRVCLYASIQKKIVIWKQMGPSRDLMFCGKYSVKITT